MKFDILSSIPKGFGDYFDQSVIGRARQRGIIDVKIYDIRDWAHDKHRKIDDSPFGGGPGMVIKIQPIYDAVEFLKSKTTHLSSDRKNNKSKSGTRVILFSTRGKLFTQNEAKRLSKYKNLILICGRYEGVDERVAKHIADEEISVGDFILSGGEIPAMIVVDAVSRFVPGVLGKNESLEEIKGSYPTYTRPEIFYPNKKSKGWKTPKILMLGDHHKIKEWREKNS